MCCLMVLYPILITLIFITAHLAQDKIMGLQELIKDAEHNNITPLALFSTFQRKKVHVKVYHKETLRKF